MSNFKKICYLLLFVIPLSVLLIVISRPDTPTSPSIASSSIETPSKKTVCLNMIVKNERDVITRCLESVLPMIDYWVIVDTGSSDETQKIIKDYMKEKGVPGELHERPWVNFSHNRNEALRLAKDKGDFVFFIDADEYLEYSPDFRRPLLDKDYYYMMITCGGSKHGKIQLIDNHLDWEWVGVLHEVIAPPASRTYATMENVVNVYTSDGARSKDPLKYQKDAEVLEAALKDDPTNARYVFYLAQSYAAANNVPLALQNYEKRVEMAGHDREEVFWSMLQVGLLQEELKMPSETVIDSYNRACTYRFSRPEPFYQIARHYRCNEEYTKGYEVASLGMMIPRSRDILFLQEWMYEWGLPLERSVCAYWIGNYEECQQISLALLQKPDLPDYVRECVESNLNFSNLKLLEKITSPEKAIS